MAFISSLVDRLPTEKNLPPPNRHGFVAISQTWLALHSYFYFILYDYCQVLVRVEPNEEPPTTAALSSPEPPSYTHPGNGAGGCQQYSHQGGKLLHIHSLK